MEVDMSVNMKIPIMECNVDSYKPVNAPLPKTFEEMQEILTNYEAGEITFIQEDNDEI